MLHDLSEDQSSCHQRIKTFIHAFHPHRLFALFLRSLDFDHLVLLDLLTGSETRFLEYLLLELKSLSSNWQALRHELSTAGNIGVSPDDVLSTLIRLSLALERLHAKQLLPYDPSPIVRRIESIEQIAATDDKI